MQLIDLEEELAAELERGDAEEQQQQEAAEQMESGAAPADEAAAAELLAEQQQQDELSAALAAGTSAAVAAVPASFGLPGQAAMPMPPPEQNLIIRKDYNPKGTFL